MEENAARLKRSGIVKHLARIFGVGENDLENFAIWAFGPDYEFFTTAMQFINNWNCRHAHHYEILLDSEISTDMPEMVSLWREKKKGKLEKKQRYRYEDAVLKDFLHWTANKIEGFEDEIEEEIQPVEDCDFDFLDVLE